MPSVASLLCVWLARLHQKHLHFISQAALEYAREKRLKVKLTCTYLQHFVSKHPEYSDLVLEWLVRVCVGLCAWGCVCMWGCESVRAYVPPSFCHLLQVIAKPTRLIAISNYEEHIYIDLWWHCFVCMSVMSALSAVILYSWCWYFCNLICFSQPA